MVFNIIGAGLSLAVKAGVMSLGVKATESIVKKIFTPDIKPKKPQETPFNEENSKKLITNILNYDTTIKDAKGLEITYSPELQTFLLKLGVHIKDNQSTLSPEQIKTLKSNIQDIDTHLQKFGITPQVCVGINDWFNQAKNLTQSSATTAEDKQKLKNERLANKVYNLLNYHGTDNHFAPENYIEFHSLEKLVHSALQKSEPITDPTVLTTILHAKIFSDSDTDEKRKITYQEFINTIKLPDGVGISKSDFDAFQAGTEIPDLEKYKTTLKASDFDDESALPTGVKVVFDNVSLASTLTPTQKNNLIDYTKKNAKNIYINVNNLDNFLIAYKKIATECNTKTATHVNFNSSDETIKSKVQILQNKPYSTFIGELLKTENSSSKPITEILKKEKKNIDFQDVKTLINHYKDSKISDVDNLFALIKDIAPDNITHTDTDTDTDTDTLITKAILNYLNKNNDNDNKDNIFKSIVNNTHEYTKIKENYPDIMKKVFLQEVKNFDEAGEHFFDTELSGFFDKLKENNFGAIKVKEQKTQTYLYKAFLKSDNFQDLDADKKLEFLMTSKTELPNNSDIKIRIQKEIRKIDIQKLPENNTHKNTILASRNIPFNTAFDASYEQNSLGRYAKNFSTSGLIFGNTILAKGKKDRLKAYQDFIDKQELKGNISTEKPQDIAKLIMISKLRQETNNLKKIEAKFNYLKGARNATINRKINTMTQQLPDIDDNKKEKINQKLKGYFDDSVTMDTISPQQMKLLANWVDFEEKK